MTTLKEYVDQRFDASDRAVLVALVNAKEGLEKVASGTDKRFDELNGKIDDLTAAVSTSGGSQSASQRFWATAWPTIMSTAAIVTVVILHKP